MRRLVYGENYQISTQEAVEAWNMYRRQLLDKQG
jgi:hypothetical protein